VSSLPCAFWTSTRQSDHLVTRCVPGAQYGAACHLCRVSSHGKETLVSLPCVYTRQRLLCVFFFHPFSIFNSNSNSNIHKYV
jgi:hypothetical protein